MNRLLRSALRPVLTGLLLLAATLLAPAATNIALSYKFDGSTPLDPNTTKFYGTAQLRTSGNYLSLTDQAQNQKGTFLIDALPTEQRLSSLRAQFFIRLDKGSSGTAADGFSFNFGPELLPDAVGEDGITNGLAVTFDTFDNGGSDSAPAVEVVYNANVLAGATFAGRSRTPVWTNDTNGLTFSTGTNYIPVIVDVAPDPGGTFSLISILWNGSNIISNVKIPYTPQQGWRVAYGARTGSFYETHYLRDVELSGDTTVQLTINSEYGRTLVDPPVGTSLRSPGDNIVLTAPSYIYLDRYRRELPNTPAALNSLAHYRARLVTTSPAPGSTLTLEKDTVVTWQWEVQNLAEVNTGTEGITGLSSTDVTDPSHADTLGRRYLAPNEIGFDSIVYNAIQGSAQPVRFASRGYVMENAPGSPERYLELSGGGDHLRADGTDPAALFAADGSFTVEFWSRLNEPETPPTQDEVALGVGSQSGARQQIAVGFGTDGGFFVDNRQARVAAPGSWTDDSWHHWAVVNDAGGGAVRLYRDGTLIQQSSPALGSYAGNGTLMVGGLAVGTNTGGFFGGGLNNLRVWRSALDREALLATIVIPRFTNGRPNLALELPFDAPPTTGTSNVVVLQFDGTNGLNSITNLGRYTPGPTYFTDGFQLPSTNTVPLVNESLTLVRNLFTATNGGGTVSNVNGPFDGPWTYNATNGTWSTAGQGTNLGRAPSTLLSFPAVTLSQAGHVFLGFTHNHSFETTSAGAMDGGQVRVSVNGGPFTQVPPSAFRQGGYNDDVAPTGAEALAGQPAFTANRSSPYNSTADLGLFQPGDTVAVQFLAAFNPSGLGGNPAWTLRNVSLTNQLGVNNYHAWIFRSQLQVDSGGDYTFHLGSDDGSQLWIDGLLVLNNDGLHASNNVSANVTLAAGSRLVEVRMFDAGGERALSLQYEGPGVPLQDLPPARLSLTASDILAFGGVTNYSTEGRLIGFQCRGFQALFPANTVASNMLAAVQPGWQLGLLRDSGTTTVTIPANGKAPLNDWRRVFWGWNKQFQFTVSVSCPEAAGLAAVARLPYFASNGNPTNTGGASLGQGVLNVLNLWLNEGEPLTVGTVYRTPDRRYTLSGLNGNVNLFGSISLDTLVDGTRAGSVSREYGFLAVNAPGSLNFQFARTIHRASLAVGQALDVATLASVNAALYPELPVGVTNLLVTLNGPVATEEGSPPNGVVTGGSNSGWAWDFVGRRWFPTKPGVFSITWPDLRGYTNTLEVSAQFPTDPETRSGFRGWELKDGTRQGSPTNQYLFTINYPGVATNYPGTPLAHYVYSVPPGGTTPAVADLDPLATDRWFFKDFAFAENNTAQTAQNRFFSDTRLANRSVLVFSRRPNPKDTATGDLSLESLVVRVSQVVLLTNQAAATAGARLESADDLSGFHAGYVTTDSLNYNPTVHNRTAIPGQWGPVYPVNARFSDEFPLSVLWFYNTAAYGDQDPLTQQPGVTTIYTNVAWPDPLNPATPVIYLSSQLGSEGVGQAVATNDTPNYQDLLDPALVANVRVYNQPDRDAAGFNPNEEHAFIAPSKAFVLTADPRFNRGQSAAFALQLGLNNTNLAAPDTYTSHPFVLVQYTVPGATNASDAAAMRAYAVQAVRSNATAQPFPRVDSATGTVLDANNQPVPQPANPRYDFHYATLAGNPVIPPYPLSVAIGNVVVTNTTGGNIAFTPAPGITNVQRALWQDRNGNRWAVSGGGRFFQRYWYPLRDDFWLGEERPPVGTPLAWVPVNVPQGQVSAFTQPATLAVAARYDTRWGSQYPVLKKGETLTYAGGEYKADHPASPGLPAVLNWASAELIYDSTTPSMILQQSNTVGGFGTNWVRRPGVRDLVTENQKSWLVPSSIDDASNQYTGIATNFQAGLSLTNLPARFSTNSPQTESQSLQTKQNLNRIHQLQADLWIDVPGDYRFYLTSGAGSQLSVDGKIVVNNPGAYPLTSQSVPGTSPFYYYLSTTGVYYDYYRATNVITLSTGYHRIDIRYLEMKVYVTGGHQDIAYPQLVTEYECAAAGLARQPIPADKLTLNPDDPVLPDAVRRNYPVLLPFTASAARVTRPLDRLATPLAQAEMPDLLTPKNPDQVLVVGTRWYFLNLPASLGQQFYYDTLAAQLVFRGRLNNLESGAPNLTQQPVQPYVLQPNFLTEEDVELLLALPGEQNEAWTQAVEALQQAASTPFTTGDDFGLGVVAASSRTNLGTLPFYAETNLAAPLLTGTGDVVPASSLGIGSALVATPWFLQSDPNGPTYVVLAENNDPAASGAVALHVIRLSEERYRGSILVLTPPDAFSENINLTHTGDFGGNTAEVYYQWWIHDITSLDQIGAPDNTNFPTQSGWQIYQQGLGLNAISFTGRPDITLADKFFFVRYGTRDELQEAAEGNVVTNGVVADASWRDVQPADPAPDWSSIAGKPVPYQWAGAANSPQLQADGSKRYLPQLVMGWVKRVLDQINAYEARYSATFNGDAPATYSSMLMEAGGPYVGPVALNSDKNNLENVGLIQLYETVLQRAKDLTAGPNSTPGTDQALLLAATRLAALYRLLGGEAYFDAQSAIVPQSPDLDDSAAAELFAFKNEVATALDEQLALLRGTDFVNAYPSYNRLFWNYVKADGEAAYNATYNIQDLNQNGLIDESDAALQYPMGHGDAWGHYLSALGMHYDLLRRPGFAWQARSELYSLLGNVLPVDYLDEKTFAVIAAEKARTGLGIVQATYRQAYSADPDSQWQGYTDTADPARAWGVAEWSRRVGQGSLFDWMTANAITPATVTNTAEGLDRIDRAANVAEVASLAGVLSDLQGQLDQANRGQNPLGLDPDAMAFDLNPFYDGVWWERMGHFQQVFDRAVDAANNARAALSYAARADQQLQRIANDTRALQEAALLQDLDYRNRLIQLYGTPYSGTIGSGQIFAEGYAGPDLVTYAYLDGTEVEDLVPQTAAGNQWFNALLQASNAVSSGLDFSLKSGNGTLPDYTKLFQEIYLTPTAPRSFLANTNPAGDPQALVVRLPLAETADYALTAPAGWGQRAAPGEIQFALNDLLSGQIAQDAAVEAYNDYVHGVGILAAAIVQKTKAMQAAQQANRWYYQRLIGLEISIKSLEGVVETIKQLTEPESKELEKVAEELFPKSIGIFNGLDVFFPVRASLKGAEAGFGAVLQATAVASTLTIFGLELDKIVEEHGQELDGETLAQFTELVEMVEQLADELKEEEAVRLQIGAAVQQVRVAADRVRAVMAEGERLQQERTALNQQIAAAAQRNRYADLVGRLTRNEAVRKYDAALDNALRYAWLAAKAYDYETSLSERHPAGITTLLEDIVETRQLGQWEDGTPRLGNAGLAGILARLQANYQALQGQIGLNNLQFENSVFSLRTEAFRITTDQRWRNALAAARVPDLWQVPEFRQYCRPFDHPTNGAQPGLVLQFSTEINPGQNFFGRTLSALDHTYSVANFATKIREAAVAFPGYDQGGSPSLSLSPRVYLLPVGTDLQRCSDTQFPTVRSWNVVSQRIPIPFVLNEASLRDPGFQPSLEGLDGSYADRIRFGDFRAFTSGNGFTTDDEMFVPANPAGWSASARLSGRSVWNTRWLLIIPGATLSADKDQGLQRFINTVTDIKLGLQTYSNMGM